MQHNRIKKISFLLMAACLLLGPLALAADYTSAGKPAFNASDLVVINNADSVGYATGLPACPANGFADRCDWCAGMCPEKIAATSSPRLTAAAPSVPADFGDDTFSVAQNIVRVSNWNQLRIAVTETLAPVIELTANITVPANQTLFIEREITLTGEYTIAFTAHTPSIGIQVAMVIDGDEGYSGGLTIDGPVISGSPSITHGLYNLFGVINLKTGAIKGFGEYGVFNDGTFIMDGGTISENGSTGVEVYESGTFIMRGGAITNNSYYGVSITDGSFTMEGGSISGNNRGVINSTAQSSFTMTGGAISGNSECGVYNCGTLTLSGGTITGNSTKNTVPCSTKCQPSCDVQNESGFILNIINGTVGCFQRPALPTPTGLTQRFGTLTWSIVPNAQGYGIYVLGARVAETFETEFDLRSLNLTGDSHVIQVRADEVVGIFEASDLSAGITFWVNGLKGDVNGDGLVNDRDLVSLSQFLAGHNVIIDQRAACVTGGAAPSTADLVRLSRFLEGHNVILQ